MKDFIWIKKNALTKSFCEQVIEKFEKDDRKVTGRTIGDRSIKFSVDLMISNFKPDWDEEDQVFFESLSPELSAYMEHCEVITNNQSSFYKKYIKDTGYQVQRTLPGEYYNWHHDFYSTNADGHRIITYIWYLNDIHEDGYTEFCDGTKIQPETGKLILFPSTWTYAHRGYPPKSETKYICTGWIYEQYEQYDL